MNVLGEVFVWLANLILSNKAKYYAIAFVGLFVSFLVYNLINNILELVASVPYFREIISNNLLVYRICYVALIMLPTIVCYFIAIPSLIHIYQREAYRNF